MTVLVAGAVWAGLIAWLLLRIFRQFRAHRTASLGRPAPDTTDAPLPDIAIIVPARNEIANIATCLAGLTAQRGLSGGSSIIVVDDASLDATGQAVADAARRDPRIELIEAGDLPAGWMGKPYACWQGALRAQTEWLCFVDADVRAMPELVGAALGAAVRQRIDMLSLNPLQELGSFWERLIIPAGLVAIACATDLRPIDDPASPEVSANGQFILIRRTVYFAVGGHAAVRGEVCEDKALAGRVKHGGWRYRMLGAEHLARTRMYTSLAALWEGLGKNAIEIIGDGPTTIAAATAAMMIGCAAIVVPLLTAIAAMQEPSPAALIGVALAVLGSAAVIGIQIGTTRHFRVPIGFALMFPLAYTAVAALAWHSAALRRAGHITWKGRTYSLQRKASPGRP
jgi:chlorobactene glucosyltransferase